MNKPLGPYEFSSTELQTLKELAHSSSSISDLAKSIRKSQPTATATIERLQEKGFVDVQRRGMRKFVKISQTRHAQLLRELMLMHPHVPWHLLLSHSQIFPLLRIGGASHTAVSRATEWRAFRNLMAHGIISKTDNAIQVNPRFSKVREFIHEFSSFMNSRLASQVSEAAAIVWASGPQFIIRVPQGTKIKDKRFKPTATSALPYYGVSLISDREYYFFSPKGGRLRPEDIALHTLLLNGVINATYVLVLMLKARINRTILVQKAEIVGLRAQVDAMLRFLDSHETQANAVLPSWNEFAEKAREYGVNP
ncbi:MAG: helix-turn-helix domain-containing protein [archaeon]